MMTSHLPSRRVAHTKFVLNSMFSVKLCPAWNTCTKWHGLELEVVRCIKCRLFHNLVTKECYMLGSFGPRLDLYEYETPPEEAPSGIHWIFFYSTLLRNAEPWKIPSPFLDFRRRQEPLAGMVMDNWNWKGLVKINPTTNRMIFFDHSKEAL